MPAIADGALLNRFLIQVRRHGPQLAEQIAVRLLTELEERVPQYLGLQRLRFLPRPARCSAARPEHSPLRELLINPLDPSQSLKAVPLLLLRGEEEFMLPALDSPLESGDRILFAGRGGVESLQHRFHLDPSPLEYVRSGAGARAQLAVPPPARPSCPAPGQIIREPAPLAVYSCFP